VDPAVAPPGPTLPPGHPFLNVQSDFYWSATSNAEFPTTEALGVAFGNGTVSDNNKTNPFLTWCVRGGMNADQY
jgi:hypothetical protein